MRQQRLQQPSDDLTQPLSLPNWMEAARQTRSWDLFRVLGRAGSETTRNMVNRGIKLLRNFPDQREPWQADCEAYSRTPIEEGEPGRLYATHDNL